MDSIIQVEKIRYAKIFRESTLLHGLINNCPGKSENLKSQTRVTAHPSPPPFSFQKQPPEFILEAALKFRKIPLENPRWISVLVAGHRPSYLFNCIACCPLNFQAVISRNIFD